MWIRDAVAARARKSAACRALDLSLRTLQRWERQPQSSDGRKGAQRRVAHRLSEAERAQVLAVSTSADFCDLPPNKIVPRLADQGRYVASESTFYRVLKAQRLLTSRGRARPKARYTKPVPLTASRPNAVWSWDITYLPTLVRGSYFYLYMHVDLYSRRIMGARVHDCESSDHAARLAADLIKRYEIAPGSLHLHSDNGAAMKGSTMLVTLRDLGVLPSFSRPRVSDDNPFSEALFKTLKYCPNYPERPFRGVAEAQAWVDRFVAWYNDEHLHSAIEYVTPQSRYAGTDRQILERRRAVYREARARHPDRWQRPTRSWTPPAEAVLLARRDLWEKAS